MADIFFYSADQEILDLYGTTTNHAFNDVCIYLEQDLKLLYLILRPDDSICFPSTSLFESDVCRYLFIKFRDFFDADIFTLVSKKGSLQEILEDKKENYKHVSKIEKYKQAYYINKPKGLFSGRFKYQKKLTDTGKDSFIEWNNLLYTTNCDIIYTREFKNFKSSLKDSEKNAFLWESVERQAAKYDVSKTALTSAKARPLMTQAYLASYLNTGLFFPINGLITQNGLKSEQTIDISVIKKFFAQKNLINKIFHNISNKKLFFLKNELITQDNEYIKFVDSIFASKSNSIKINQLPLTKNKKLNKNEYHNRPQTIIYTERNYMGDTYEAGQVGAQGPNANAHDITFNQIWQKNEKQFDLSTLNRELEKLRKTLKIDAETPEHYSEIGAIANAEIEAKNGNGANTLQALSKAGKWSLGTAEKIGVGLATAALKTALGM